MTDRAIIITERLQQAQIPPAAIDRFVQYDRLLIETNRHMNLTAITEPVEVAEKHFLDSVAPLAILELWGNIIDVGTGAGFPGIALLIMRPDIQLTLLDALGKRCIFLRNVLAELGLKAQVVHARAEDWARTERESYDIALSRAVAPLRVLLEYQMPLLRVGGSCWCYKGRPEQECAEAENALATLGASQLRIIPLTSTTPDAARAIVWIEKGQKTPLKFPRRAGKPEKSPL